ncbi:MAG: prepilin-type N-terminal cleavage/methylation domain-containing protein [Candidatus Saccharimonadales bacterium]
MMGIHKKQTGFTIVELLIVIVIIGILAAITIVAYNGIQGRARDTQRAQDMQTIVKALELYKATNGVYPAAVGTANASGWEVSHDGTAATNFLSALSSSKTISVVPLDPKNFGVVVSTSSLAPSWTATNNLYFYHRYAAGNGGCDVNRGNFYVLGVTRFDTVASGQSASNSPGFSCPGRNWAQEGAWVTGGYTN